MVGNGALVPRAWVLSHNPLQAQSKLEVGLGRGCMSRNAGLVPK